jgi:hypothetical protein
MLAARVSQHRLRRLRATATQPAIELVDALDVRARFAFQNYTASFAAFDCVHESSLLFLQYAAHLSNSRQPMRLTRFQSRRGWMRQDCEQVFVAFRSDSPEIVPSGFMYAGMGIS